MNVLTYLFPHLIPSKVSEEGKKEAARLLAEARENEIRKDLK